MRNPTMVETFGRNLFFFVAISTIGINLINLIVALVIDASNAPLTTMIVRTLVIAIPFYFLYYANQVARWSLALLFLLLGAFALAFSLYLAENADVSDSLQVTLNSITGLIYLIAFGILAFAKPLRAFFEYQREVAYKQRQKLSS